LNRKSILVEEAVEEVLYLVQKANESVTIPKLEQEHNDKVKNGKTLKYASLDI